MYASFQDRNAWRRGLATCLLSLPWLISCGGGGAGADTPNPASDDRAVLANDYDAPTIALEAGDATMQMALLAQRALISLGGVPQASVQRVCSAFAQGTVIYNWDDTDGNGRWSAGDTVSATFSGCRLPRIGGTVDGSLVATLLDEPQPNLTSWSVAIRAGAPIALGNYGRKVQGAVNARFASTAFSDSLSLSAGSADSVVVTTRWGQQAVVTAPSSSIERHYNLAESRVRLQFKMSSALVGGKVDVVAVEPFVTAMAPEPVGQHYMLPVSGMLHIVGANEDRIEVGADAAQYTRRMVRRDSGVGTLSTQYWAASGINESLWWIGAPLPDTGASPVEGRSGGWFYASDFATDLEYPDEVTGTPRLRIFFAVPVSRDPGSVITLKDDGARTGNIYDPRGVIPTDIVEDGGTIVLIPRAPLPAGRVYQVWNDGGPIRFLDGSVAFNAGFMLGMKTRP